MAREQESGGFHARRHVQQDIELRLELRQRPPGEIDGLSRAHRHATPAALAQNLVHNNGATRCPQGASRTVFGAKPATRARRMDSRTPDFQTPTVEGDTLTMKWKVTYTKPGLPNLIISGVETAVFEGEATPDRVNLTRG